MSIKKRLDLIIKELGLSGRAFEKECGLTNGSYSSIRDGVGADKLNKIILRYPQISADWLISGEGEMMKINTKNSGANSSNGICEVNDAFSRPSMDKEDAFALLGRMAGILSGQQKEISRLINELELNGKRSDRLMELIETDLSLRSGAR